MCSLEVNSLPKNWQHLSLSAFFVLVIKFLILILNKCFYNRLKILLLAAIVTLNDVQRMFEGEIPMLNKYFNLQIIVVVFPDPFLPIFIIC